MASGNRRMGQKTTLGNRIWKLRLVYQLSPTQLYKQNLVKMHIQSYKAAWGSQGHPMGGYNATKKGLGQKLPLS